MKKFVFSLEKVLGYKQQILDLLKNELSRLQMERNKIEQQIEERNCEFDNTNHSLIVKMQNVMAPHDIAVYKSYLSDLNRRILELQAEKQKAVEAVEAKQKEIVQMNSDISGLERLKDKQLEAYLSQERKAQETFIEEFVGRANVQAG